MLRTALVTVAFAVHVCVLASSGNSNTPIAVNPTDTQPLINREQEIELALKAAPVHLRKDATVFVFTKSGYEKVPDDLRSNRWQQQTPRDARCHAR